MMLKTEFDGLLMERGILLTDGGLATELENRGFNLAHPLWSGKILQSEAQAITSVHEDFYRAGADMAITSSYQASSRGLAEHLNLTDQESSEVIQSSVRVAAKARDNAGQARSRLLIAGSVGPYGAYLADGSEYRGDYSISKQELKDFHRSRIQDLVNAGVDVLAFETIPHMIEIEALLELLRFEFPSSIAWLSCTLRDSTHISDGTSVEDVLKTVNDAKSQIVAFGVNCVSPRVVEDFLQTAKSLTSIPLICYPNSGESFDAVTKTWYDTENEELVSAASAAKWVSAGARIVGGCCRTSVEDIRRLAQSADVRKLYNAGSSM